MAYSIVPIRAQITREVALTLYPQDESGELTVRLTVANGSKEHTRDFQLPITFQRPDRVVVARYAHSNI